VQITKLTIDNGLATLTLVRDKVHALNEASLDHLLERFEELRRDDSVRVVVFTGEGSFFSFGLDVPSIYDYTEDECARFLGKFTRLYAEIYAFPKPVIAAINGHAIAGGCMLANACDYRIMVSGKAKISLNEVTFGSSIFAGSVEILRELVGTRNAETVALTGRMFSAEEAHALGLVDRVVASEELATAVGEVVDDYLQKDLRAYAEIKHLLREPVLERIHQREQQSIQRFINLWYSPETREKLKGIQIK
jgi:enoyl-CoA hydratase/carnithine racemase